jgi:hypothetical protein
MTPISIKSGRKNEWNERPGVGGGEEQPAKKIKTISPIPAYTIIETRYGSCCYEKQNRDKNSDV